ncbi:Peptidase propeptide and YPEB domain protein [compost metagenome]
MRKMMMALLAGVFLLASPALANGLKDDVALDALAEKVTITPAQAVKAAKTRVQGRVKEICLKAYSGKPVYKVEFDNDREVLVDARTGRVMERPSGMK